MRADLGYAAGPPTCLWVNVKVIWITSAVGSEWPTSRPYVAGQELPLANGLPLGLADAERCFQLVPDQQLTLLTDGVVEARDQEGALFGFERSAALSAQPAEAIACAAQAFG